MDGNSVPEVIISGVSGQELLVEWTILLTIIQTLLQGVDMNC